MDKNYRKGVTALIVDSENNFLVAQLIRYKDNEWNFIGGGAEENESFEDNLKREISEELGISENDFTIIAKSSIPQKYDFPEPVTRENGVKYDGQIKEQFLVRFTGDKSTIILQEDEIREIKWVRFQELKDYLIFPNQFETAFETIKELYPKVIK